MDYRMAVAPQVGVRRFEPLHQLQSVEGGMFFEDVVKQPVKAFGAVLAAHARFDRCGGGQISGNFLILGRLLAGGKVNEQQHRCGHRHIQRDFDSVQILR